MLRATNIAAALFTAAVATKVDHASASNWINRRVIQQADRPGFGVVKEEGYCDIIRTDPEAKKILKSMGFQNV